MIFWESISIGAGHTAKSFVYSAFLRVSANPIFTPSALKYSPLYATLNCHHFPAPPLAEAYSHGSTTVPKIAIDWVLWVADIFSRRRGVRWWPFSPVVAGTHGSAQRPVYRHKNIKNKTKQSFFYLILFLESIPGKILSLSPAESWFSKYSLMKLIRARILWVQVKMETKQVGDRVHFCPNK